MSKYEKHPEDRWKRAIETAFKKVKILKQVSDARLEIHPNAPFPVPGLNPDIKVEGRSSEKPPKKSDGGLTGNRVKIGFGVIELTLSQPGFVEISQANPHNHRIADAFRIQIYFPREYPCALGYGVLFVDDEKNGFEIPEYPNIMKRKKGTYYWDNICKFGGISTLIDYPNGCMCHMELTNPQNKPADAISMIAQYLTVMKKHFDDLDGARNDQGFDRVLYGIFHQNQPMLAEAIKNHKPGKSPGRRKKPLPPPPPGGRPKKPLPPPPKRRF